MDSFVIPENKEKFLALKAKEESMLRQYEYNINMSKTMLINSNAKFKERVIDTIKTNEMDVDNKLSIYQRKMGRMGSEVMDKIIVADDYEYLSNKMNDIQTVILEEFIQKYKIKLEAFLSQEEKKTGDYYSVIKQKLETIILGKMSKIKKIETTYIKNIKEMYRQTMDELEEYKRDGLDVIVVEKKCLKGNHLEGVVEDMKEKISQNENSFIEALSIMSNKFDQMENKIQNLDTKQPTINTPPCAQFPNRESTHKDEGFELPMILTYHDPIFILPKLKQQVLKQVPIPDNNFKILGDEQIHTKKFLDKDNIPVEGNKKIKNEKNIVGTNLEEIQKKENVETKFERIEFTSNVCENDKENAKNIVNLKNIQSLIPNYNNIIKIDNNYAQFFEITPLLSRYTKRYGNWRSYIKSKIYLKGLEKHDIFKVLFEYTHKLNLWIEKIKDTIETRLKITIPESDLNKTEHCEEALGVGYIYDDEDEGMNINFDSDGYEINSD